MSVRRISEDAKTFVGYFNGCVRRSFDIYELFLQTEVSLITDRIDTL